jgi:acyl-[acyl-carrier-protein] desaturase
LAREGPSRYLSRVSLPTDHDEQRLRPQVELLQGLRDVADRNLSLLTPVDDAWQPTDYLPDLAAPDWHEQLARFRGPAEQLGDDVLVVLVGDMVTEEALPNYAVALNLIARDYAGDSPDPWARWMRGWTAEENRHGDLLNAYLRLTGRVDMRAVEVTVHHLIAGGFNPRAYPDLYAGLIYTSFQERATKLSHLRVGRLAERAGDASLGKICKRIAGDESRHERFYTLMTAEVMARDPGRAVSIFADTMRRVLTMPGRLMYDGRDPDLFEHFAVVAQRLGVYTARDYAAILRHLVATWGVAGLSVSGPAAEAQEYLCALAERLGSFADAVTRKAARQPRVPFSWVHGRPV